METPQLIENLNNDNKQIRLDSLKQLIKKVKSGELPIPETGNDVNNHIHTSWSFSPYSPTKALWMAYNAGLITAGIMDHDTIMGAPEFIKAGEIAGIATTIGVECRANFSGTPLYGKRINNPDQKSIAYVAIHGIPHSQISKTDDFFKPYRKKRNERNIKMVAKLNQIISPFNVTIDFERDVVPISQYDEGGAITERHILYALSLKLISLYGKGPELLSILKDKLKLNINSKTANYLADQNNPHYAYDLLGLLKSELVSSFYINATDECPHIKDVINLSKEISAIMAYAYLGDVGDSVTGDKKAQKFEDDYIETLFECIKDLGFNAVTYMPSRNTPEQLDRLRELCANHDLFQISGEDINSSRQSFVCEAMRDKKFNNLIEATWALIGHERLASQDLSKGMFTQETKLKYPTLEQRVQIYKARGMELK